MSLTKKNTFLNMIQHQQKQQIKEKANLFLVCVSWSTCKIPLIYVIYWLICCLKSIKRLLYVHVKTTFYQKNATILKRVVFKALFASEHLEVKGGGEWGQEVGNYSKKGFTWGGSTSRSNPLPFYYIPFLIEKVPL